MNAIWSLLGTKTPYTRGGDSPYDGFDCSGCVGLILQLVGLNYADRTAQGFYDISRPTPDPNWLDKSISSALRLVFYKSQEPDDIAHVGFALPGGIDGSEVTGSERFLESSSALVPMSIPTIWHPALKILADFFNVENSVGLAVDTVVFDGAQINWLWTLVSGALTILEGQIDYNLAWDGPLFSGLDGTGAIGSAHIETVLELQAQYATFSLLLLVAEKLRQLLATAGMVDNPTPSRKMLYEPLFEMRDVNLFGVTLSLPYMKIPILWMIDQLSAEMTNVNTVMSSVSFNMWDLLSDVLNLVLPKPRDGIRLSLINSSVHTTRYLAYNVNCLTPYFNELRGSTGVGSGSGVVVASRIANK
jgi:hypothetical protein